MIVVPVARTQPFSCPVCLATIDVAGSIDGVPAVPRPGDLTMCMYCGAVLAYAAEALRVATVAEARAITPESRAMMERIRRAFRKPQ